MLFTPRPKGLGGQNFLKLNDGESVTGAFRGDIYKFKRHWVNGRGVECDGPTCTVCKAAQGDKKQFPTFRFRINFVTNKDNQWSAKIFESGGETYDLLETLDKKYDLSKMAVEITRIGLGTKTKYQIFPLKDYPITDELKKKLESVSLHALSTQTDDNEMPD